jgi:L-aspartate oxidase
MGGDTAEIRARAVLLATGGLGQLYETTTNPEVATGDGVAMAWRAGAWIRDIEFVQFHPTALKLEGAPSFLISEALRGEGARLLNARGERFMERYDARGELAPRDVVARSMVAEMALTGRNHVLLDISGRGDFVRRRFPRIHATCLRCGIDLDRQPAPVAPAAHYAMGGVETDLWGRTDVPGLWAAGEVASTGVHGANRLASNSLLEGIVFGARAGLAMEEAPAARTAPGETEPIAAPECAASEIRALASRSCGITRDEAGLSSALIAVDSLKRVPLMPLTRGGVETANLATLLRLIASAALARQESRGAHYRADFPQKSPPPRHSRQKRNSAGVTLE